MANTLKNFVTQTSERSYAAQMAIERGVEAVYEYELFKLASLWKEAARQQTESALEAAIAFENKLLNQIRAVPAKNATH